MKKNILIADDDINIIASLKFLLEDEDYHIRGITTPAGVVEAVSQDKIDLLLMDMNFQRDTTSGGEGLALVKQVQQLDSELPIIVMTGWATVDLAVEALTTGAKDFVQKPWNDERLLTAIQTQLHLASIEKKARRLNQHNQLLSGQQHPQQRDGIIAHSPAMQQLLYSLEALAASDMNILLTGDNGTGKSMLAHYLHRVSSRAQQSFISVNMGAISENLFESEMFGHIKGAFTDARETRIGRFEMAEGGTLFLDELANIPLSQQAKLLRVLEEQQFERLGSSQTLQADVRVVSATNANLNELIAAGAFRQDLYYRLNTIELRVPSLTERVADIQPLAEHFLASFSQKYHKPCPGLSDDAISQLQRYAWPGNIRELSHLMERVLFTCQSELIEPGHLALNTSAQGPVTPSVDAPHLTLEEIEQQVLVNRLQHHHGNATETARSLGLSRSGYYRRLSKYGLDNND